MFETTCGMQDNEELSSQNLCPFLFFNGWAIGVEKNYISNFLHLWDGHNELKQNKNMLQIVTKSWQHKFMHKQWPLNILKGHYAQPESFTEGKS